MQFNKNQGHFLSEVITEWERDGTVDPETATTLRNSFSIRPFDWAKLAMYSFFIAVVCVVIALIVLVADDFLVDLIERFYSAPDSALCLGFGVLAAVVFYAGLRKRRSHPENVFGNESVLFVAVLFTALSVRFLGNVLDDGSGHYSLLLLLAALLYGVVGAWFESWLVWIFSLVSLGSWYATETGFFTGWQSHFLGMNYPLRFVVFGAVLTGASLLLRSPPRAVFLRPPTYVMGLVYFFTSLWIVSITGNYGDWETWSRVPTTALWYWGVLLGVASLAAIAYGLKYEDAASRGIGLAFLFLNLYTRYCEYFWNHIHKAVFFLILALSFWLIGRKAEKIWNMEFMKKNACPSGDGRTG
ncbi:MAG: DUF2157 domain-containing protein [Planctomycetes bacterium]|nr:DUF2157 domain-containing protein [Planctomycetota bacterium]MCD7897503.1 hypothetical protein [Planctomycetaceae bacterium]